MRPPHGRRSRSEKCTVPQRKGAAALDLTQERHTGVLPLPPTPFAFVTSPENRHGIGSLLEINGGKAIIGYFDSPVDEDLHYETVSTDSLVVQPLEPQTRVYFQVPATLDWWVGRVLAHQPDDHCYLVQFPNSDSRLVAQEALRVRWFHVGDG